MLKFSLNKPNGVIIPTALFVAMFVLMMVTLLVSKTSMDMGNSANSLERTEFRYLSLAAANELLADLNAGQAEHDDEPRSVAGDGRITESWVEPVEAHENYIFVIARTFRPSSGVTEKVRRFAIFQPKIQAKIYASVADTNKDSPDPIYYADSGSWSVLPSMPRLRYSDSGKLQAEVGQAAGSTPFYVGARDDSVYAIYAPTLDGWNDPQERAYYRGLPIPLLRFQWGDFVLNNLVTASRQGQTSADMAAVTPLIHEVTNPDQKLSLSRGAVPMKFSHATNQWTPLPAPNEAVFDGEKFVEQQGNYWVQGVPGPMAAHPDGVTVPLIRKGRDAIYRWKNGAEKWDIIAPPGQDIIALATDQVGTTYVQTGLLNPSDLGDLLQVLSGNFRGITPKTSSSALHRLHLNGEWERIPDPPPAFFDQNGELQKSSYNGNRGPLLGSMVGGEDGELYLVSRPHRPDLVDTIFRFRDGEWEALPSPPNVYYAAGTPMDRSGAPERLELALGADGEVTARIPSQLGADAIFVRNEDGQYELLPPVQTPNGGFESTLYQISGGGKPDESGRGTYRVKATYF